ncbi:MAG: phospho-sugar mutase [Clostridia bacterium]
MYKQVYLDWLKSTKAEQYNELNELKDNEKEIKERFSGSLAFGTAGMRGIIGMGTNMMNEYVVAKATQGVAQYICSLGQEAKERGVILSYDTRRFSFEFAMISAQVLAQNGINAFIFEDVRPVPMCSFAIRELHCVAGIMITASHNAKEYNGYKLYGDDGAQMSPEPTAMVVDFIDKIENVFAVKRAEISQSDIKGKDNFKINNHITVIGKSIDDKYFAQILKLSLSPKEVAKVSDKLKIVYTPIHGAGYKPVTTILAKMGISPAIVEEQKLPDTEFSTVKMPNPEQPDALALGIKLAKQLGSDIVIGTDPDCDRMGVAIRDNNNEFILLTGNQIGSLLMDYILMRNTQNGTMPSNPAVIKTIVTTEFAQKIADKYNVTMFNVLTGFKFIGGLIKEWEVNHKHTFMFGFEESYGYLCGTHARDKDAVVASMLFAEMVCYYEANNVKLFDKLEALRKELGYFFEDNFSVAFKGLDGMEKMSSLMDKLKMEQTKEIAGLAVVKNYNFFEDKITLANGETQKINLPKSAVLKFDLGENNWACIRPSGTEPKLKLYVSSCAKSMQESKALNAKILTALIAKAQG